MFSTPHETHSPLADFWRGFGFRERTWWMEADGVVTVRNHALHEPSSCSENEERAGQDQ